MPLQPLASAVIHLTSEAHGTVKSVVMARSWTQPAFYFCAILGPPRSVHHKTFAMIAHREESSRKSASRISSEARSHRPSVVKKMSPGGRSQGLGGWCLNSCALLGLSLACTPCKFRAEKDRPQLRFSQLVVFLLFLRCTHALYAVQLQPCVCFRMC